MKLLTFMSLDSDLITNLEVHFILKVLKGNSKLEV